MRTALGGHLRSRRPAQCFERDTYHGDALPTEVRGRTVGPWTLATVLVRISAGFMASTLVLLHPQSRTCSPASHPLTAQVSHWGRRECLTGTGDMMRRDGTRDPDGMTMTTRAP